MNRLFRHIPLLALTLAVLHAPALADSITLREQAVVSGSPVRLADVADLEGEFARRHADLELAAFGDRVTTLTVTLASVRERLDQADVHWGRLILRGAQKVNVARVTPAPAADADKAPGSAAANPAPAIAATDAPVTPGSSLRSHIEAWVRTRLGQPGAPLRIRFEESDAAVLGIADPTQRFDLSTTSRDVLGRVPVIVRRYRGETLLGVERVTLAVSIQRTVVVASRAVGRGQMLTAEDVTTQTRWLDALAQTPAADLASVIDRQATRVIRVGEIIHLADTQAPTLVERGQPVTVHCLSGGLALKTTARAMETGGEGQLITVRNDKTREMYQVRITGPQEAVMILDVHQPQLSAVTGGAQ